MFCGLRLARIKGTLKASSSGCIFGERNSFRSFPEAQIYGQAGCPKPPCGSIKFQFDGIRKASGCFVAAVYDRRPGAEAAPLQVKRVLQLPTNKFLPDKANLQDAQPDIYARDSVQHNATSANTILPSASHGRKIPSANAARECSSHAKFSRQSFSSSSSIQKAGKDGGHRPPLQRAIPFL